jgi:hypothetical protein
MPNITHRSGQLYNPVLTNLGRHYRPKGFIANQLAPTVNVELESGEFPVWESWHFFANDVETLVPDRSVTREIDLEVAKEPYVCEEHALKVSVSDREQKNSTVDVRRKKRELLDDRLMVAKEIRIANLLKATGDGGGLNNSGTPSNNWNVDAGTIEADLVAAKEAVADDIGIDPNTLVIPWKVANAIATQQDIREIFKYTVEGRSILREGAAILPPELWGMRVIVPRARTVTNAYGQTNTFSDIWGDDVRVLYVNPNPSEFEPSVLYTIQSDGYEVRTWRTQDPAVEWVRARQGIFDEKVVAPDAGYVIKDVLS